MAVTTATGVCKTAPLFTLSVAAPPALNYCPQPRSLVYCNGWGEFSVNVVQRQISSPVIINSVARRVVSSAETPIVEEEQGEETTTLPSEDDLSLGSGSLPPLNVAGCKTCGRPEIENGCNGEGRIQGGIATFPGLGWWPIKAYRPCPAFVASGGRYRRTGQSMDEVVSGGGGREGTSNEARSSKKKEGPRRFKT